MQTLNNYLYKQNEPLYNRENLEKLKQFILTKNNPIDLDDRQLKRFRDRFKSGYTVKDNKIYHKGLELVAQEDINDKLQELYDDPNLGLGFGIASFYHVVINKYIGIKRDDIEEFLKNQTVYQLTKEPHKGVNKPILSSFPNERWAIDLVDMNPYKDENGGYRYILTCIDYFSKYVWAEALKNNTSETVSDAMDRIAKKANTYPKIIQSDNGSEFKGAFDDWTKEHKIDHVKTLSYSPKSNGLIKNFNKHLRKLITIRYNSLDYLNNKNNHDNSTTKYTPAELWREGTNKIRTIKTVMKDGIKYIDLHGRLIKFDDSYINKDDSYKQVEAIERIRDKAFINVEKNNAEHFEVGEKVRVLVSSLYSKVRKVIKEGNSKLISVKYSPEIFTVAHIVKPKGEHKQFMKERYFLLDSNSEYVLTEYKINDPTAKRDKKLFFGSELLRVGDNIDNSRAKELNNNDAYLINTVQTHEFTKQKKDKDKDNIESEDKQPSQPKTKNIIVTQDIEPRTSGRVRTKNK